MSADVTPMSISRMRREYDSRVVGRQTASDVQNLIDALESSWAELTRIQSVDSAKKACKGKNCCAVDGKYHSADCILEAAQTQGWDTDPVAIAARNFIELRDDKAPQIRSAPVAVEAAEIPEWDDVNAKLLRNGWDSLNPLEKFIHHNEPSIDDEDGYGADSVFRNGLLEAIKFSVKQIRLSRILKDGDACQWTEQSNCDDEREYRTECGAAWMTASGTPEENDMRYCPMCGKRIALRSGEAEGGKHG